MKIWGEVPKVSGVYGNYKSVNKVEKSTGVVSKKDTFSVSNMAKDYQTVMKAIKDLPNIRQDKVKELADRYEAGNYNTSGRDIADQVITSMFNNRL